MPPDENTRSVGVGFHRLRHAVLEVLLVRRVLDDGHDEGVEVGQRARSAGDAHAFDHLRASLIWSGQLVKRCEQTSCRKIQSQIDGAIALQNGGTTTTTNLVRDGERRAGPQQRGHDRVLRVRVDAAPCVAQVERVPEQRRAGRLLEVRRGAAQEYAVRVRRRRWIRKHEHVDREDALLLHAGGRDVHLVPASLCQPSLVAEGRGQCVPDAYADPTTGPGDPSQLEEG